ncbi:MAG: hypothetical protein WCI05_08465 [Myxococcales bacterium]
MSEAVPLRPCPRRHPPPETEEQGQSLPSKLGHALGLELDGEVEAV